MRPTPDAVALLALAGVAGSLVAWLPGRPFVVFAGTIAAAAGMCLASPNRRLVGAVAVTELSFGLLVLVAPIPELVAPIGRWLSPTTLLALHAIDWLRARTGLVVLSAAAVLPLVVLSRLGKGWLARGLAVGVAVLFSTLATALLIALASDLLIPPTRC